MINKFVVILFFELCIASHLYGIQSSESDWPQWRGPHQDGKARASGAFAMGAGEGLKTLWKKPLGSGYASVSIADGRAFTMFSDSTFDYLIGFNAENGQELWRYNIDSTYVGHDGSHSGPISTPLVLQGQVYALGRKGQLLALDTRTGRLSWAHDLKTTYQALEPFHGFGASPVASSGQVIVQAGGARESTVLVFDKDTGELLWSAGSDTVQYQSAMWLSFPGENQVFSIGNNSIIALDAGSGKEIWKYRHAGGWMSSYPVLVDRDQLFLNSGFQESMLLKIKRENGAYQVSPLWKSRNIKQTHNISVHHEGHIYGYSGRFLTCLDAATGNTVWKSRPPGDGFLILVDDHLVVLTKKGSLHIAPATPEGYREQATLQVFDGLTWTPPSFANSRVYLRNLYEIASVGIGQVDKTVSLAKKSTEGTLAPVTEFAKFIRRLELAPGKKSLVDQFMRSNQEYPVVETDSLVHLVYRGKVQDLVLTGDMFYFGQEVIMTKVPGTDFYYKTVTIDPYARLNYQFIRDFDQRITDPLNPRTVATGAGTFSELAMPKWSRPKHLSLAAKQRSGRIDTLQFESKLLRNKRSLLIYLPHGFDLTRERYPVVYVTFGKLAIDFGQMPNTLDNIISERISSVIAVFIPLAPGPDIQSRFIEYTGDLKDEYVEMLAKELVPAIDAAYRTKAVSQSRAIMGGSHGGTMAIYAAFKQPGIFGAAAGQSILLRPPFDAELENLVLNSAKVPTQFYLDWGTYDQRSIEFNIDRSESSRKFAKLLRDQGYVVRGGEAKDGYGWASWRNRTDKLLEAFWPISAELN